MKNKLFKLISVICALLFMGILLDFNWAKFIKLKPFISVVLGMLILTVSQYKRTSRAEDLIAAAKWNLLFAGFLTTLMSILSFASITNIDKLSIRLFSEQLLPLLYSSILYLFIHMFFEASPPQHDKKASTVSILDIRDLTDTLISDQVFQAFELTNREKHVAAKLLDNASNKEIAAQLYISEATVKKHIQNIYQKLNAADRNSFREIYFESAKCKVAAAAMPVADPSYVEANV